MPDLKIDNSGPIRFITLARQERRNAVDEELIAGLTEAFRDASDAPTVRVVVLRAEGSSFSAGADLRYMQRMANYSHDDNVADAQRLSAMFESVANCRHPVVCLVQGPAIGGGVGLVAASDIAICGPDARFAFSEVRLGILPAVISPFVIARIGTAAARQLFLTGDRFGPDDALRLGLVDRVVDDLDEACDTICESLLKGAPGAHQATKRMLAELDGTSIRDAVILTPGYIATQRATAEATEGFAAFFDRRPPEWATDRREPRAEP